MPRSKGLSALAISDEKISDDVVRTEHALRMRLPSLLESFQAQIGILWIRTGNDQLRWAASQGVEAKEIPEQSVFARDLLWNAEEAIELGCCQIYNACDESVFETIPCFKPAAEEFESAVDKTSYSDLVWARHPGGSKSAGDKALTTTTAPQGGESDTKIKELVCKHAQLLMPVELPGLLALYCAFVPSDPKQQCGIRIYQLDNAIDALLADEFAPVTISLSRGW